MSVHAQQIICAYFVRMSAALGTGTLVVTLLVVVVILSLVRRKKLPAPEAFFPYFQRKPVLYWFVDAEANARNWWDFGGRSSKVPNRGYLAVALKNCMTSQAADFQIVPLIGRQDTLKKLHAPDTYAVQLPPALWRSYVISNLCAYKGGLVIDGNSVLTLGKPLAPVLLPHAAARIGSSPDEMRVAVNARTPGAQPYIGWAAKPNHPAWMATAKAYRDLTSAGPQAWTSAIARRMVEKLMADESARGMSILREVDGSRKADGTARTLEDYFGRSGNTDITMLDPKARVVMYDGEDLERRYEYNWFLRLSKEQLDESEIAWTYYAGLH